MAGVAAVVVTGFARAYAQRRQLLDLPGDARRNHVVATPRGGGIAILLVMLAATGFMVMQGDAPFAALALLAVAMLGVGGIGWWDDHRPLSIRLRLGVHLLSAACLAIAGHVAGWPIALCIAMALLALVLVNFWNFMDGIDGIAASQAAVVALLAAGLSGDDWQGWGLALAGACIGFLCWNFPRARIFMGDVGSGLLGLALAWSWATASAQSPFNAGLVLLPMAPCVVDAGLTLLMRMVKREAWWQAHSSHTYQLLARRIGRHVPVTLGYLAFSVAGAVLAWLLRDTPGDFMPAVVLAWYTGLAIMWWGARRATMARSQEPRE